MNRVVFTTLCLFLSLGCSPYNSPKELRENPALSTSFEVDASLQQVIKRIRTKRAECNPAPISGNVTMLDELGEATIEYSVSDSLWLLVDLKKQDKKTQVTLYAYRKALGWERAFKTLEYGAKGLPGCP